MIGSMIATRQVMAEEGVAGLSLSEVARRMGIQPPSLYKYFPSRLALYDALFQRGAEQVRDVFRAAVAEREPGWETLRTATLALMRLGPKGIRNSRRVPTLVRRLPIGRLLDLRFAYILDVLSLRDPWMHRVDLSRATERPLQLDNHDHEIVAQVISELAQQWHGPPVTLKLTGTAGGQWTLGRGTPVATVTADEVDYLRALAGRNHQPALHIDGDETAATTLAAARIEF